MYMNALSLHCRLPPLPCIVADPGPCPRRSTAMNETTTAPAVEPALSAEVIFDLADARRIELDLPYSGAVTPKEAWMLVEQRRARLVDVRTPPEYKFVGCVPGSVNVEWRGADVLPSAMFVHGLKDV